jgi:hypothetical protein
VRINNVSRFIINIFHAAVAMYINNPLKCTLSALGLATGT